MSSISGISSGYSSMMRQSPSGMQGMQGMKRLDSTEMANDLFSKLDTSGRGYIEEADLQNAFDKVASRTNTSGTSASSNDLFSQIDTNEDGKVTKQEFSDLVNQFADQLNQQFVSNRMQGTMPPGPPPGAGDDIGMTKEELASAAQEVSGSDSNLSSRLSDIVNNFDAADANQDGKFSILETLAYQQSQDTTGTTTTATSENAVTTISSSDSLDARLMMQIMKLTQTYGIGQEGDGEATSSFAVAV